MTRSERVLNLTRRPPRGSALFRASKERQRFSRSATYFKSLYTLKLLSDPRELVGHGAEPQMICGMWKDWKCVVQAQPDSNFNGLLI
jgi:hypothetical protein